MVQFLSLNGRWSSDALKNKFFPKEIFYHVTTRQFVFSVYQNYFEGSIYSTALKDPVFLFVIFVNFLVRFIVSTSR